MMLLIVGMRTPLCLRLDTEKDLVSALHPYPYSHYYYSYYYL